MAREGRFTEARLYVAASTIALLLVVWAALAVSDSGQRSAAPVVDGGRSRVSGTSAGVSPSERPQIVPQTRTRAS